MKWDSSPMRKPAGEREWHHAARSSCVTTGSTLSDDSGVAGVAGEGDLEHAVVEEEDMGGKRERRDPRMGYISWRVKGL